MKIDSILIANLHSILSGKWYMEEKYAEANLPLLMGILLGGSKLDKSKPYEVLYLSQSKTNLNDEDAGETQGQVAVISIKSPIYKHDQDCGPRGTKTFSSILASLEKDPGVAGVVLDIDSGGGQAYGTPLLHDQIRTYSKPIVTYTDGMMCSAAYYIGSSSDHIVANKRAEAIGSIGAYAQILDLSGFYEMKGAKLHTIYATKSADKNKAYREVLEGNYKLYRTEELDPLVENFIADMKNARTQIKDEVFGGSTYNGIRAVEQGLADSNGTLEDAIDKVYSLAKNGSNRESLNKSNTMKKTYANLTALLAVASLAMTDKGTYLNEEQLDSIDNRLDGSVTSEEFAAMTKELNTLEQRVAEAELENEALQGSIAASLKAVELEAGETAEKSIEAMRDRIVELGKEDGATPTRVGVDGREQSDHSFLDGKAAHNQIADEFLN